MVGRGRDRESFQGYLDGGIEAKKRIKAVKVNGGYERKHNEQNPKKSCTFLRPLKLLICY